MESKFKVGDVVQFTEDHKWCGCIGFVSDVTPFEKDTRYLIGIAIPSGDCVGTAYIFSMENDNEFEYIGVAVLTPA